MARSRTGRRERDGKRRDSIDPRVPGAAGGGLPPPGLEHAEAFASDASPGRPWREPFLGGSQDEEQRRFRMFAHKMRRVQERGRTREASRSRALHAKMLAGTFDAELQGVGRKEDGYFGEQAGPMRVTVRFSSASGRVQADGKDDLRGVALRIETPGGLCDLLMTNAEVSHVRDADEFIAFASAMSLGPVRGLLPLVLTRPRRALAMLYTARAQSRRKKLSLAADTFYSRAPFLLAGTPVRYQLCAEASPSLEARGERMFFEDLAAKLARGDIHYALYAQPYLDEQSTPLEDASRPWTSAPRRVARLTLKRQQLPDPSSAEWRAIDALRFDPWNTYPAMRPVGSLNRARRYAYKASQEERSRVNLRETSWLEQLGLPVVEATFQALNRLARWDRFGTLAGTLNLVGLRHTFRKHNLTSTDDPAGARPLPLAPEPRHDARSGDGTGNDATRFDVGAERARFGRNVRFGVLRREADHELETPPVGAVSEQLLARTSFLPAPSVNLLAVAWVQFQIHDWFEHRERPPQDPPAGKREQLARELHVWPSLEAERGSELDQVTVPAYENATTHWWDCSQIYGSGPLAAALRDRDNDALRATLRLDGGLIPRADDGMPITGKAQNWWLGLEVLHTLFAREHNALCQMLRVSYASWDEQRVYEVARLINAAQMAKIHTVEWTPAVFGHPTLRRAMRAHWDGLFGKRWHQTEPPFSELRNGIPGSPTDHFEVPFALTEEFVSVYRLHPLLPDSLALRDPGGSAIGTLPLQAVAFKASTALTRQHGLGPLAYSLALGCAGQMRLHNYPAFLRALPPEGTRTQPIDLAAVEIFRDRERSVPRYNTFREQFGLERVERFEDLEVDEPTRDTLRTLYEGDIDRVDLLVGLLSELPPAGFAISDTAFRVFVGMASRRLKSDRFLTDDYREQLYTHEGLAWIERATFKGLLQRHLPELQEALASVDEVFAPWRA